ncbi:MAG: HEAT repeat domain-containing protein, partial [Phycisphaerae bacterium]|nr:HEAT repeat domain-containing protein [Phycisphaerae bacterium]
LLERKQASLGETVQSQLATRFAALREPTQHPVNEIAQAAWFYCTIEHQPERALMLAQAAAERAPADAFVQRVLGWALALNLRHEDAQRRLLPIAGRDASAAYLLAKLLRDAGELAAARRVIESLEPRPVAGPACDLLNELDLSAPTTQPETQPTSQPTTKPATTAVLAPTTRPSTQPILSSTIPPPRRQYPELAQVLATFDERVLEFHRDPARFLEARVTIENPSLPVGCPWWAVFTLTNRGPFPITLGPDAMVNPVFLLSFSVEGDRTREYPALMTVNLDHVRVLYPGQSAHVRRTLDVGPLRRVARGSPQHLQRVTLQVLLDVIRDAEGRWRPSPGGQRLRPAYFNRLPATTGQAGINALFRALTGESAAARVRALEVMAQLVGERQRADWKRLEYRPAPVPAERMKAALLNMLGSESWELRVRTLEGLQVMGLDRQLVDAVEACLEHPHWLVRMMAVRLLARQGAAFAERAGSVARNDPDELVRALAESYLTKWRE